MQDKIGIICLTIGKNISKLFSVFPSCERFERFSIVKQHRLWPLYLMSNQICLKCMSPLQQESCGDSISCIFGQNTADFHQSPRTLQ